MPIKDSIAGANYSELVIILLKNCKNKSVPKLSIRWNDGQALRVYQTNKLQCMEPTYKQMFYIEPVFSQNT